MLGKNCEADRTSRQACSSLRRLQQLATPSRSALCKSHAASHHGLSSSDILTLFLQLSSDVSYLPTYQANIKSNSPIAYMSPTPLGATGTYNVYFTSNDSSLATDACSALPANTPNLANSVVVVQRGTCTYTVKYKNIAAAGGKVVLLYNSADALMLPQLNVGTSGISAVGGLTREAGLKVRCSGSRFSCQPLNLSLLQLLSLYTSSTKPLQMTFPNASMVAADSGIVGVADDYSGGLISCVTLLEPCGYID